LPPDDSEQDSQNEPDDQPQDVWEPTEPPKYSLYLQQQGRKPLGQSRLQFYLDDQRINIGLLTPELEDSLEMVALRFIRQDHRQPISVSGGVKQIALGMPAFTLTTEHLLLAVVLDNSDAGRWLQDNCFEPAELYERIGFETADGRRQMAAFETAEEGTADGRQQQKVSSDDVQCTSAAVCRLPSAVSDTAVCRLLDAAANRGREAIRVIEDYVRFMLDDADLTQRLKTFRHQFQNVLQQFSMQSRLTARNTEYDVGTDISADGEYLRPTVGDLLSANFSRLQESLRSLEEFSKMFDSQAARQFEQLRYQCYTLHKDVALRQSEGLTPLVETADGRRQTAEEARLYALVDTRPDESAFKTLITAIIAGGVDIIQLRDKQADDRTLLARSRILKECIAASERKVLFIMNDRPDLAILAGAGGVPVGQEELPAALVRQIVGTLLIGVSTHSIEQARQAVLDGADYIGAGPVFESATKEFSQLAGLSYWQEVAAEIAIPAFAIGGITEDRLDEVLQTGIHRIAVGSALLTAENPKDVAERFVSALSVTPAKAG
jgi:thiamine-phosphate pyrophosphorylase